jgi:co-chaperonin GroES (HSP10)
MKRTDNISTRLNWWEFAPAANYLLCEVIPDETVVKSESGIYIKTQYESPVVDRPICGVILAVGPEDSREYKVGEVIFWEKTAGYDMANLRKEYEDQKFVIIRPDSVIGKVCKDTRKKEEE